MHREQNFDEKVKYLRRGVINPSGEYATKMDHTNVSGIIYERRIVINPSGEYKTEYQAKRVVTSSILEPPLPNVTRIWLMKKLFYPDKTEAFLLLMSFLFNVYVAGKLLGLSPFDPDMIIFWGIFNFILTAVRWSDNGPFRSEAKMISINNAFMKGENVVVNIKFAGMLASIILIIIGVILS